MPQCIKQFLKQYLSNQTGWKALLIQNWPTIIGDLKDRITLEKVQDDLLVLGVTDSSWLQELYLLSPVIIQTINENLDQPRIKQLRFRQLGRKKNKQKFEPSVQERPATVVQLTKKEQGALENIQDKQLRAALKKFLVRCYREKI